MSDIGHNLPPDMSVTAGETAKDLSGWMAEHPVIDTDEDARAAKVYIDRAALCEKDLEDERKGKTNPLNEQVKVINDHYRAPRELLKGVCDELKRRFDTFLLREETKRIALAQDAARRAAEAEQAAREAERMEREAFEEADAGVAGLDIAARTAEADQAFSDWQRSKREEILAERETKVRLGRGLTGRERMLRNYEILVVEDPIAAIRDIGLSNEGITEAIKTAARAYKRIKGQYPNGIQSVIERKT